MAVDEHGIERRYTHGYSPKVAEGMARIKAIDALRRCVDLRSAVLVVIAYLAEVGQDDMAKLLREFNE